MPKKYNAIIARLPVVTVRGMSRVLERLDFKLVRIGKHVVFEHPDGRTITIPNHPSEVGPRLLAKILKQDLQMAREEFPRYAK